MFRNKVIRPGVKLLWQQRLPETILEKWKLYFFVFFCYRYTPSRKNSPWNVPPLNIPPRKCSPLTLFRFVGRFACVRIEDSSRNRFASTEYFLQSQTTLFPCILFMRGMFRGGNNRGGIFRGEFSGGEYSGPRNFTPIFIFSTLTSATTRDLFSCRES